MPQSRQKNLVVQELNNETLIYDLETNKAFCLNELSALIWNFCDGAQSVAEINRAVAEKLKAPITEEIIGLAIAQFEKENLLIAAPPAEFADKNISRRELIRRAALTASVALPVVSSLVAPKAAAAQSQTAVCGGSCTCSVPNTQPLAPLTCRVLGGTSGCPNRTSCDCFVVAGEGSTGGTCTGT